MPVTQLRLVYALGPFVRSTLGTQVFSGASQRGAIQLVSAVVTVSVPIALVVERDAEPVAAPELADVASREIFWKNKHLIDIDRRNVKNIHHLHVSMYIILNTHCSFLRRCCHRNCFDGHISVSGRCTFAHLDIEICLVDTTYSWPTRSSPRPCGCGSRNNRRTA